MSRPLCASCQLPLARCYCDLVVPVSTEVEVVIWQHPAESNHPKGTAALLNRCLQGCQLLVAERLTAAQFDAAAASSAADTSQRQTWLLYPQTPAATTFETSVATTGVETPVATPVPIPPPLAAADVRLLVLDGTWRKAAKLLHTNPWLQQLPRLSLAAASGGEYSIRKARQPHQLSTLEATCQAVDQLQQCEATSPLLNAFRLYMQRLSRFRPPAGGKGS